MRFKAILSQFKPRSPLQWYLPVTLMQSALNRFKSIKYVMLLFLT